MADLRPYNWNVNNTRFEDWFERDRSMVRLVSRTTGHEILCLWDEAVTEFVEDGYKTRRQDWHEALCEYATTIKLRAGGSA